MVVINRTHKDSCENARVLLPLIGSHSVQSGAANAVGNWCNHALRTNVHK